MIGDELILSVHTTNNTLQTVHLGERLGASLQSGKLILFTGGLGSGKTAFCSGLAKGLGCNCIVNSPTFSIANVYNGRLLFAHFDVYRITSLEDLETAGFYDYLESGAVVAVEWSENIAHLIGNIDAININFETVDEETRIITIENGGAI